MEPTPYLSKSWGERVAFRVLRTCCQGAEELLEKIKNAQVAEEAKQAIDRTGFECMKNVNEIFAWVVLPTVVAPALGLLGFRAASRFQGSQQSVGPASFQDCAGTTKRFGSLVPR
jgi:hypothetical protein